MNRIEIKDFSIKIDKDKVLKTLGCFEGSSVYETVFVIPVNGHAVGEQGIQPYDFAPAIPDDLGVSVAINQQMGHQRFPKHKAGHFRVRLVVE